MMPEVGAVCRFTFIPKFNTLNGVYRVRAETNFQDAVASGINLIDNLYQPAGLESSDYNNDYNSYINDRLAVLESVLDTDVVYYTPESIFLNIPDPTVREFYPLTLVVDLGIQKNTQEIFPLLDQIEDLIKTHLGTENSLRVLTNPQNRVYLTESEYEVLLNERQANINRLAPFSTQIRILQQQNQYLAAKVQSYEAKIIQQSS